MTLGHFTYHNSKSHISVVVFSTLRRLLLAFPDLFDTIYKLFPWVRADATGSY